MFTGFPSTQAPAVQWWDFSKVFTGTTNISLANDCAPIQYFATGGTTTAIQVTLPQNPAQGKTITFKNDRLGNGANQTIQIIDNLNSVAASLSQSGSITFCYISQNTLSTATNVFSNWVVISGGSGTQASNSSSVSLGGTSVAVTGSGGAGVGGSSNTISGISAGCLGGTGATVSGNFSAVVSGNSNTANTTNAVVAGGSSNTASGTSAMVAGGSSSTASGVGSAVLGGDTNTAAATRSAVIVGNNNTISASGTSSSVILGGNSNAILANNAIIAGGTSNNASGDNSVILGGSNGTTRSISGNIVSAASSNPISSTLGINQFATLILARQTTDATATVLASNSSAAATTNQITLPNNSAYYFRGEVIAGVTGAGDTKGWYIEGVIKRGANAAATSLVGTPSVTSLYADAGAATWSVAVTANATLGCLTITCTGQAATTIRWVAQVRTTEMTY